jgi:hypothetical protein
MSEDIELSKNQKVLLDVIRKDTVNARTDTEVRGGYPTPSVNEISGTYGESEVLDSRSEGSQGRARKREKRSTSTQRAMYRPDTRSGQIESTHVNPPQSNDRTNQETRAEFLEVDNYSPSNEEIVTPLRNDDNERQKILNAQRQERYRDRQKQAQTDGVTVTNDVTRSNDIAFKLKNLVTPNPNSNAVTKTKEPVKLITKTEIDDLTENLAFIYKNGSGLLDSILEIIVKGHEDVSIWQLDDDEAETLARMHLEKGRVSKEAAQSARKLLSLYDQLYFIMLLGPRAAQTGKHIIEKGGLSFK